MQRILPKVALVALVDHLRKRGFVLLDIQFVTDHLLQFGATEIPASAYEARLDNALEVRASWSDGGFV